MSLSAITPQGAGFEFDEEPWVPSFGDTETIAGTRLPDGRTLAWREYGNPRGVPCVLMPDIRSSRLAPGWLLHDSALPVSVRLIAVDRPGTGMSTAIGFGGTDDPADDLSRLIQTLAVGRVVLIGIGHGADAALAVAERHPDLVASVSAVSVRTRVRSAETRWRRAPFAHRSRPWSGPLDAWERVVSGDPTDVQSWQKALRRMEPLALQTLGNRWEQSDFRAAVAADLAETDDRWVHQEQPEQPRWVHDWAGDVPVHCWHGREESPTQVSTVRAIADGRPGWTVTPVPGTGALLGSWPEILTDAAETYLRVVAR